MDDLTPQARIRTAAVELFGSRGFRATTVRQIAERAGVSAPLVMHHFRSKEGLREACDDWVMDALRQERAMLALGGGMPALADFIAEHPEFALVMDYIVAALREGGDMARRVFDRLCETTDEMLAIAESSGLAHLPEDREATIAFLVASSCGVMLLDAPFARRLGGPSVNDPVVTARYARATSQLFTHGLFTPAYLEALTASIDGPSTPATDEKNHD